MEIFAQTGKLSTQVKTRGQSFQAWKVRYLGILLEKTLYFLKPLFGKRTFRVPILVVLWFPPAKRERRRWGRERRVLHFCLVEEQ